ncbi:Hypothetical protein, putative [Bodo saltans]|uniref:EF-hand domain-containing protein n=1 Tax=Bodo saltans TaxID=75058 RepID=A0A0S4J8V3_BODSA|nr:Hypothetical protein, putative [Bodo saltans]|eukprot:CUG86783.1 Hypothetical protein, putative [Bodo saltans]
MRRVIRKSCFNVSCASRGAATVHHSFTTDDRKIIVKLLEHPEMADRVLERLSPGKRRYLLVAASSTEWQPGSPLSTTMDAVDEDQDSKISAEEYRRWVERSLKDKQTHGTSCEQEQRFHASAPFVAFGCLDNSLMLLSGDAIDGMFGERFGLTAMGAAALGGVCSGTIGIQVHGMAERVVSKFMPHPKLTSIQRKQFSVFRASHVGGTLGILCGLTLGMFPLLFIGRSHNSIATDLGTELAAR